MTISDTVRDSPHQFWEHLAHQKVDLLNCTPSLLESIVQSAPPAASLRHLVLGGEAFPRELQRRISRHVRVANLTNFYGPTETTIHPGGGLSWSYSGLMRHLPADRPIYGLQARGISHPETSPRTLEEMAADYVTFARNPVGRAAERQPLPSRRNHLAVDQAESHFEVVHGLRDQWVAVRPVVAPARDQADAYGVAPGEPDGGLSAGEGRQGSMKVVEAARNMRVYVVREGLESNRRFKGALSGGIGMPDYWVFQDSLNKRAWIHRSTCSVFKGHLKGGGSEGAWHGAFETYDEARRTATEVAPAKKGAQLNCRVCRPEIM